MKKAEEDVLLHLEALPLRWTRSFKTRFEVTRDYLLPKHLKNLVRPTDLEVQQNLRLSLYDGRVLLDAL